MIYAAETVNPEAFINATVAANAAENAATNAFLVSIVIALMLLALGLMLMFIVHKISQILQNQNEFLAYIREVRIADRPEREQK